MKPILKTGRPTAKQLRVLDFIEECRKKIGMAPSFQEIQAHFGYSSLNSVQNHIRFLRKKGLLESGAGVSRKRSLKSLVPRPASGVPLVGRIAAGAPIEAIENVEGTFELSSIGIDNSDNSHFALRVKGESMIGAHILDNDLVVIKKQPDVGRNEIAAVLWNNEATLKYVFKKRGAVYLVPANETMSPIEVTEEKAGEIRVLGKVVRVIRSI